MPQLSPRRPLAGPAKGNELLNPDPSKHYVQVDKNLVAHYEDMGYEAEKFSKDGVRTRLSRGLKPGQLIEWHGTILMSISREEKQRIDEEGIGGNGGKQIAEAREREMVDPRTAAREQAGGGAIPAGLTFINETEPSRYEVAR